MATSEGKPERRSDALTKERIVATAVSLLDEGGEGALTFRALAQQLSTGFGAIYWHVDSKNDLLAAAANAVVVEAARTRPHTRDPREAIRAAALGVFDAIDAHPWAGAQLAREPWQAAVVNIFEYVGAELNGLGVPQAAQFDCASALVNYILGLAGQYAAGARTISKHSNRTAFIEKLSDEWVELDAAAFPFVRRVATQLREHDDRHQFLVGVDLILTGIEQTALNSQ